MDSNKEKRPLSNEEIDYIKEDYGTALGAWCESEWLDLQDLGSDLGEDWMHDLFADLGVCDSLKSFVALSWSDWRDHLNVLDVDGYLDQDRYSSWPGDNIDEAIVKFVFLTAYGIELS